VACRLPRLCRPRVRPDPVFCRFKNEYKHRLRVSGNENFFETFPKTGVQPSWREGTMAATE